MAINFLRLLTQPDPFTAPQDPMIAGNLQEMTGRIAPENDRTMNILQAIGGSPDTAPVQMPASMQPAAKPAESAEPPRKRRSFLDTIGQISDVIARVGGAEALYQPTLDARADRERMLDTENLQRQLLKQNIAAGEDAAFGRGNERLAMAVRGLQAIQKGGGNIEAAWPLLARQAGIPEDQAAMLGQIFSSDANALEGVAAMFGQGQSPAEFGLQPFYVQRPDGTLTAYQLGKDGSVREIELGEGEAPIDPLKFVDLGGTQAGVGTRSGTVRRVLPNTVRPDTQANIRSRERIAAAGNSSRERIAAMRKEDKGGGDIRQVESIVKRIGDIRNAVERLDQLDALVDPKNSAFSNFIRRARSSGTGQLIEGFMGTQAQEQRDLITQSANAVVFSMKQALGLTSRDLDTNQDVQRALGMINNPNTTKANMLLALDTLEDQFTMMLEKARRQQQPTTAPRRTVRPAASRPQGGRTGDGWGKATIVRD